MTEVELESHLQNLFTFISNDWADHTSTIDTYNMGDLKSIGKMSGMKKIFPVISRLFPKSRKNVDFECRYMSIVELLRKNRYSQHFKTSVALDRLHTVKHSIGLSWLTMTEDYTVALLISLIRYRKAVLAYMLKHTYELSLFFDQHNG